MEKKTLENGKKKEHNFTITTAPSLSLHFDCRDVEIFGTYALQREANIKRGDVVSSAYWLFPRSHYRRLFSILMLMLMLILMLRWLAL